MKGENGKNSKKEQKNHTQTHTHSVLPSRAVRLGAPLSHCVR
jgi:hypothetical protein